MSQPASAAAARVRGMLWQKCTAMASRAPTLALATTGDRGAEFFAQHSTPVAPR